VLLGWAAEFPSWKRHGDDKNTTDWLLLPFHHHFSVARTRLIFSVRRCIIVGSAGNRIEHASSMHRAASAIGGGIRWALFGASEPPSKCIDRCRTTADKNPTPLEFLSDRLHFETRPPFHCALCTGSSANDWSSYCTLWIRAPTGMLLTVEGTGTGFPRECDRQGAVSTTSLPARGL